MKTSDETRKLPKAKDRRKTHWCYQVFNTTSLVNGKHLRCEAHLECKALLMLGFDKDCVDVETNLESVSTDRINRYTPDLRIVRNDGTIGYVEIKSDKGAQEEKFRKKLTILPEDFARLKMDLKLITASDLWSDDECTNHSRFYLALTALPPDPNQVKRTIEIVRKNEVMLLEDLVDALCEECIDACPIWFALAKGWLWADTTKLITSRSTLKVGEDYEIA